ncbi:MAG TPA: oligosaccharide flippase family protein [Patescibacteria group bacterium]
MSQATPATSTDTTLDLDDALGESEVQEFKKRSVSGAISYTVRSLFLYGIGLVTSLLLAAYLDAEAFGIYGLVTQIVSLLQFFSDVGLGPTLIQKKAQPTVQEFRVVFTVQQLLSWFIFACTVLLAVSGVLNAKLTEAGIWVLLALGASFPLSSLKTIPAIILERKLDFSRLVIPSIFEHLVYSTVLMVMVISGIGVKAYAYAVLLRAIVGVIVMYWLQGWPMGLHLDRSIIKTVIGTGVKFQAADLLAKIKDNVFYLVLGWFLPLQQFGYITFAKQWSQVPYMLTVQNVIAITFPAYSRLQHDKERLKKAIEKSIFFITLTIFPILVGMSLFIIPVTELVERYAKWQPAIPTFIFFTLSIAWAAVSTPLTNALNAIGKINVTLKLMIMWTVLTWGLTPVLMWFYGFNGVALAAFVISFTSVLPIYYMEQYVNLDIVSNTWRQLLAALLMTAVGYFGLPYWQQSFAWLVAGMVIVGSTYILTFLVIGWRKITTELKSLR